MSQSPKEVRDSDDGRWELRIYPQSYEVIDRRTGDLAVRRTGTRPAFSPTQRFLVADAPPRENEVSVYDLVARRVVLEHVKNFLLWLYQDSIALEVGDLNCLVSAYSTLVDANAGNLAARASGCAASGEAWTNSKVDVSVDGGYVLSIPPDYTAADEFISIGSLTGLNLGLHDMGGNEALLFVRASIDKAYSGPSKTWKLHVKIRFVSGDFKDARENGRQSGRNFLIATSHVVDDGVRAPVSQTAELREPITRGLTRDDRRGLVRLDERGLARIDESRRSLLDRSLQQMIGSAGSPARVVVFLDACQSGSAALGSDSQNEAAIERLKNGGGPPMLIFAASKTGQVAGESASRGGGYFTAALVKTLLRDRPPSSDGTPRLLRLNELYTSVKREVLDDSDGLQIPWLGRRGLLGDFVMF